MASGQQADDRHEREALHNEAVSKLSTALGIAGPDVAHAERLGRSLGVERLSARKVSTTRLPRTGLFGGSIVEAKTPSASTSYATLQEALPDWYEAHNRHCGSCQVPLLLGLNASFGRVRRDNVITCGKCGTCNVIDRPSKDAKSALRSQRVREKEAAATHDVWSKKRTIDDVVSTTTQKPVRSVDVVKAAPSTLSERQAELRRQAKGAKKAAMQSPSPAISDSNESTSTQQDETIPSARPSQVSAPSQTDTTRLTMNKKQARPRDPKPNRETLLLQSMLEKNRKRQEERSKKAAPKSGLQDFLGSL